MKRAFTVGAVLAATTIAFAEPPPKPPTGQPTNTATPVPNAPPVAAKTERVAQLTVQSVKPALTARHELYINGFTQQMPMGGYTWKTAAVVRAPVDAKDKGLVRLTVSGTADGNAAFVKGVPGDFAAKIKVEVPELKEKRGEYNVEVVDEKTGATIHQGTMKL